MARGGVSVHLDLSGLNGLMGEMPDIKKRVLQKIAQDTEGDIKSSFSPQSPSSPGDPPGVDTGALKNSIVARPDGGDWVVRDGVKYGVWLEYGTSRMAARPFFLPAIQRAIQRLPSAIKAEFKG